MAISAIMGAISTATVAFTTGAFLGGSMLTHFLISTALGAVLNALTPKPSFTQSRGFTLQGESGAALDHQIIYGEVRVGGARIYDASTGTDNEYLHRILAFAGHEINSYQQIWINDAYVSNLENTGTDGNGYVIYNVKEVTDPDGNTSARYDGFIQIKQYLGTTNQPADANLITDTASLTDGQWTTDHKLSNIAYLYVRFKYSADAFPNGVPAVSAIIRGKKVYDPRTATTAWSDNPALCLRDYLTSDYGMSQPSARINDTLVSTAANICEQSVESEERYTCNGAFVTNLTPSQIITDLLTSMGGLLWYAQGQWRMKAAAYTSPVADFDEDDLRSQISVSTRHSRRDGFNKVKGTFRGAETDWQQTDYPAVASIVSAGSFVTGQPYTITEVGTTDFTLIGASSNTVGVTFTATGSGSGTGKADYFLGLDNGISNVLDYALPFTASSKTAQRIARIALNRNREQLTVSASFGMRAFAVQVGDIVRLTNTRFGWTNKEFEVLSWTFGLTDGLDIQVQMTLREISSEVFTSVNGEAFSLNNTTLPNPFSASAPTGLTTTDAGFISSDGTFVNSVIVSWSPPANAFVDYYEFEWKKTSDTDYNTVEVSGTQYQISPVKEGTNYTIRVRVVNKLGVTSAYVSATHTPGGDNTAPSAPTSVSAIGGYQQIIVKWVNPTDDDFKDVEVFVNSSNTTVGATAIGTSAGTEFTHGGLPTGTTNWYFVKARDFSGNASAFSTGASDTTLADPTDGKSVYTAIVFQRSASVPATPSGGSFNFGTNVLTPPTGWFLDVPAGTNPIYGTRYVFSIIGDTGTDNAGTWSAPFEIAENGVDGLDGADGADGLSTFLASVFKRSSTAPATPTGGSYNFGTNTLTPPSTWSTTIPSGTDPVYVSTTLASVQGVTGTDSTLTWSAPVILAQNGTDGAAGSTGDTIITGRVYYQTLQASAPSTPSATSYNTATASFVGLTAGWSLSQPSVDITDTTIKEWSSAFQVTIDGVTSAQTLYFSTPTGAIQVTADIESDNYVAGTSGWKIERDTGNAEFQNATIRGTLNATDITAGTISADRLPGLAVANSTSISGTIIKDATATYTVSFSGVKSGTKLMVIMQLAGYSSADSPYVEVTATGTSVTLDYTTTNEGWLRESPSGIEEPQTYVSTGTTTSTSGTVGFNVTHRGSGGGTATVQGVVAALVMEA